MKKVAIIYSGGKYWGGIETLTANLFKYYDKNKIRLIFYSLGEWPLTKNLKDEGVEVRTFPKSRFQPLTIFKIAKEAKKSDVKLLVSGGLVADSYARAASLFSGIPHLSFVHSDFNLDYSNVLLKFVYGMAVFVSAWKTKAYIAVSHFLKEQMVKRGVNPSKIYVIPNGVELPPVKRGTNEEIIISSFGRLHPVKGYDLLIEAMAKVPKGKLFIYGEGAEKDKLEKLIRELSLNERVKLMGYSNNITEVFAKTDIYVQTSRSEGFGLGVVEAMLSGLPVLVTPCGSLPELIKNGETGIVSESTSPGDIADALEALISDKELQKKLGSHAQDFAKKNFDVEKWGQKVSDVFFEIGD